jgi:hypothetical protein
VDAVAIGNVATATGTHCLLRLESASILTYDITGDSAVSIGSQSDATGDSAIAIGDGAQSAGATAVAIGDSTILVYVALCGTAMIDC